MGVQAMISSYKANSIRKNKPTYFESVDLSKTTYRKITSKKATQQDIVRIRTKIKRQNHMDNIIYSLTGLGIIMFIWYVV